MESDPMLPVIAQRRHFPLRVRLAERKTNEALFDLPDQP
jgi:hypothetical protein